VGPEKKLFRVEMAYSSAFFMQMRVTLAVPARKLSNFVCVCALQPNFGPASWL